MFESMILVHCLSKYIGPYHLGRISFVGKADIKPQTNLINLELN